MILLRRLLGDVLRERRREQGRTLREVSSAARVSLGYLSEVERGQKEASSELLGSICEALDVPMSELLREVSDNLALAEAVSAVDQLEAYVVQTGTRPAPVAAPSSMQVTDLAA
ncbi:MAG: helix-turn-helix transcriptional regulator [Sporichthyaceae bacterium]